MTTIADVRDNLAEIANGVPGWYGSTYVGDSVAGRVIKVSRPAFDPRVVFGGSVMRLTFRCVAHAQRVDSAASEAALDELAELSGVGSFIAAVQDSDNWSTTIDYAVVTNVGEVSVVSWGDGVDYLVCPFDVEVVW
jgi:hypothetical protein